MVALAHVDKSVTLKQEAIRHIIPISGKDSLCTAIVQKTRQPAIPYEYLYNDTYVELPEVYAWLEKVEQFLGLPIQRVGANLEDIIMEQGGLPGHGLFGRFCTRLAKVQPMEESIGASKAYVYYGLRSDEPERVGYKTNKDFDITPIYPLREMSITLPLVWRILQDRALLPPAFFWQQVHDRVMERLGPIARDFVAGLEPWEFRTLFSWRSRPNCYLCYNQRVYEWIGLLDHHPDLYWHSAEIEETVGQDNGKKHRVKMFTWRQGESLRELVKRADEVREKRVRQICKTIVRKAQGNIFVDDGEELDELAVTSCGLYCGK
jgi:hypothetical protein